MDGHLVSLIFTDSHIRGPVVMSGSCCGPGQVGCRPSSVIAFSPQGLSLVLTSHPMTLSPAPALVLPGTSPAPR